MNILTQLSPIQTNTISSLESINNMLMLLKQKFTEVHKLDSQWVLVDEKTNTILGEI